MNALIISNKEANVLPGGLKKTALLWTPTSAELWTCLLTRSLFIRAPATFNLDTSKWKPWLTESQIECAFLFLWWTPDILLLLFLSGCEFCFIWLDLKPQSHSFCGFAYFYSPPMWCDAFYVSLFLGLITCDATLGNNRASLAHPSKINGLLPAPGCLIDTEWDWFCWIRDESLWVSPCRYDLWNIIIYRGVRLTSLI